MRKTIVVIVGMLAGSMQISAQGWKQIAPGYNASDLVSFVPFGHDTIFAAGLNWTMHRSIDAGKSWSSITRSDNDLHILRAAASRSHLFLLPEATRFLSPFSDTRVDSTATWIISFDPGTGDTTWLPLRLPRFGIPQVRDLDANSNCLSVLVGLYSMSVFISTDEGATWESMTLPDSIEWHMGATVLFPSRSCGIVICEIAGQANVKVPYLTTNGGKDWTRVPGIVYPGGGYGTFTETSKLPSCADGDSLLVLVSSTSEIHVSTDVGRSWTRKATVPVSITKIAIRKDGQGFLLGDAMEVYVTSDLGSTWIRSRAPWNQGTSSFTTGCMTPKGSIVAGGTAGTIISSNDLGVTWNDVRTSETCGPWDMEFFNHLEGVVAFSHRSSSGYSYYRTSDAGATWSRKYEVPGTGSFTIKHATPNIAYAFRAAVNDGDSTLFISTDAGLSWSLLLTAQRGDSLAFNTPKGRWNRGADTMFFWSQKGLVRFTEKGRTMRHLPHAASLNTGSIARPSAMYMNKDRYTWILFQDRLLRGSADGERWEIVFTAPDSVRPELTGLSVVQDSIVYLFGWQQVPPPRYVQQLLFKSKDYGNTWTTKPIPAGVSTDWATMYTDGRGISTPVGFGGRSMQEACLWSTSDEWTNYEMSIHQGWILPNHGFRETCFVDSTHGWLLSSDALYATSNGGIDWVARPYVIDHSVSLGSIYPHPGSTTALTRIDFSVLSPVSERVSIEIHDLLGRRVCSLYEDHAEPGEHSVRWNSDGVAPGVYFVALTSARSSEVRKMLLLR
jgi:photosystem II stability/assembly factor-like uncharacterized protein